MEYQKYIKYKIKYLNLKYGNNQYGGVSENNTMSNLLISMQANATELKNTPVDSPYYNRFIQYGSDYEI